jgi:hypothetical protein
MDDPLGGGIRVNLIEGVHVLPASQYWRCGSKPRVAAYHSNRCPPQASGRQAATSKCGRSGAVAADDVRIPHKRLILAYFLLHLDPRSEI